MNHKNKFISSIIISAVAGTVALSSMTNAHADFVSVDKPLTSKAGDAKNGEKVVVNRKKGNCLACHTASALKKYPFHGEVGPSLDGVASRYSEGVIRGMIIDQRKNFPETIMPSMHSSEGFTRVMKKFKGKTILSAQEVEDVVAFLLTLK